MASNSHTILEILRQIENDNEERRHEIYVKILKHTLISEEVEFDSSGKSRSRASATVTVWLDADEAETTEKEIRQTDTVSLEEKSMEPAIFAVKAIAGAVLGQSAKDAYGSVRDVLKTKFGLGSAVALIEENPEGSSEQTFLAEKLTTSGALDHQEFREKVAILVEAMKQDKALSPQAQVLIEDITAKTAEFRDVSVEGSAGIKLSNVDVGKLVVENIKAKS